MHPITRKAAKATKTTLGWEPAFWDNPTGDYIIEPGFALPTEQEAQDALERDLREAAGLDAQQRLYAVQYAYACGYHD